MKHRQRETPEKTRTKPRPVKPHVPTRNHDLYHPGSQHSKSRYPQKFWDLVVLVRDDLVQARDRLLEFLKLAMKT